MRTNTDNAPRLDLSLFAVIFAVAVASLNLANADTMSSSNYKIESDSLNFGGGRSTSASYTTEDTLGEITTGMSSSTNYTMLAGYQQMQAVAISVTPAGNVTMSPAIGGVTGGTANGSTNFSVITDDMAGYSATIVASTSPALRSATSTFADYVPTSGPIPDYTYTNLPANSSFGFTTEGADIDTRYKYTGSTCNSTGGTSSPGSCWDGLSTTPRTFVRRNSANQPGGTVSTILFRAVSGSNHIQMSGTYTATTTVTIIPL